MVRYMGQEEIFERFLKTVHSAASIKSSKKGLKSGCFEYISDTNAIVCKEQSVKCVGGEYEKGIKVHLYKVKEDLGNIYVENEEHQKLLVLTSAHDILKIKRETKLQNKHFTTLF
jgi:hypothetical protein